MTPTAHSDVLHERVSEVVARAELSPEEFTSLALDIARFQAAYQPALARLLARQGGRLETLSDIPVVTVEAFRNLRLAVHPAEQDEQVFFTSGTTGDQRGRHFFRRTSTYRQAALRWGRRALLEPGQPAPRVLCLAPAPATPPESSLGFMLEAFHAAFDAAPTAPPRWLLGAEGLQLSQLRVELALASEHGQSLLVLGTSFAYVYLLDALGSETLPAPAQTTLMLTGGFKGKTREIPVSELRRALAQAFGVSERRVIGEYGMTELSSQLYEGTLPGGELVGPSGVYLPPPWLDVTPVEPVSLQPVASGEVGLARFIDLANVDSSLAILTRDQIRRVGSGIELLGRAPGAEPRGCSLAIEALLGR